jgi:hypothetical protein
MPDRTLWELSSYIITTLGLPFAILVFIWEQRRERRNEEAEIYQRLSNEYTNFMRLVLENPDLRLLHKPDASEPACLPLAPEQRERQAALFNILVALFERAYILVYDDRMNPQTARLWQSWEDFMREWCRKPDFRGALPELLQGEDAEFAEHITRISREEHARIAP